MARFVFVIFAIVACAFVIAEAYENCCTDRNGCNNACAAQSCAYSICCSDGCTTGGGQTIPACACACGGCPNAKLVASGLLGRPKFAKGPAMLFEDGTTIYKLKQ